MTYTPEELIELLEWEIARLKEELNALRNNS